MKFIVQAPLYDPEDNLDQDSSENSTEEEDGSTSGMGIGIVIGIIIIVILVLGAIAGVIWYVYNLFMDPAVIADVRVADLTTTHSGSLRNESKV